MRREFRNSALIFALIILTAKMSIGQKTNAIFGKYTAMEIQNLWKRKDTCGSLSRLQAAHYLWENKLLYDLTEKQLNSLIGKPLHTYIDSENSYKILRYGLAGAYDDSIKQCEFTYLFNFKLRLSDGKIFFYEVVQE